MSIIPLVFKPPLYMQLYSSNDSNRNKKKIIIDILIKHGGDPVEIP